MQIRALREGGSSNRTASRSPREAHSPRSLVSARVGDRTRPSKHEPRVRRVLHPKRRQSKSHRSANSKKQPHRMTGRATGASVASRAQIPLELQSDVTVARPDRSPDSREPKPRALGHGGQTPCRLDAESIPPAVLPIGRAPRSRNTVRSRIPSRPKSARRAIRRSPHRPASFSARLRSRHPQAARSRSHERGPCTPTPAPRSTSRATADTLASPAVKAPPSP